MNPNFVQVRLVGHSLAPLYPNPLGSQGKTIQSQVAKHPGPPSPRGPPDHILNHAFADQP